MQEKKTYIVDFYADWCPPCKQLIPKLEARVKKAADTTVLLKVNVDNFQDLAGAFSVSSIPHVVLIKEQEIVEEFRGVKPDLELDAFFTKADK